MLLCCTSPRNASTEEVTLHKYRNCGILPVRHTDVWVLSYLRNFSCKKSKVPFVSFDKDNVRVSQQHRCLKLLSLSRIVAVEDVTMVRYWVIFGLVELFTVWAGGQCPTPCRCPSVYVADCASAVLRKVPNDRYVFETFYE